MMKRIVKKSKPKKLEKSEKFSKTLHEEKKSRLRAFARTRAKNPITKLTNCTYIESLDKMHVNFYA